MGLDSQTPTKRCRIKIEGENKWLTLILIIFKEMLNEGIRKLFLLIGKDRFKIICDINRYRYSGRSISRTFYTKTIRIFNYICDNTRNFWWNWNGENIGIITY